MKEEINIYPLTIVRDRYGGTYSGAEFLAFNLDPAQIPDAIGGSDPEEIAFWAEGGEHKNYPIGKGSTPDIAAYDLLHILDPKNPMFDWSNWDWGRML